MSSLMNAVFGWRDGTPARHSSIFWPAENRSFSASLRNWKPRSKERLSLLIWILRCAWRMRSQAYAEKPPHRTMKMPAMNALAMETLTMGMLFGFLRGFARILQSRRSQRVSRGLAHLQTPVIARFPPIDLRQHQRSIRPVAVFDRNVHQRIQQGIGKQMRLQ